MNSFNFSHPYAEPLEICAAAVMARKQWRPTGGGEQAAHHFVCYLCSHHCDRVTAKAVFFVARLVVLNEEGMWGRSLWASRAVGSLF